MAERKIARAEHLELCGTGRITDCRCPCVGCYTARLTLVDRGQLTHEQAEALHYTGLVELGMVEA